MPLLNYTTTVPVSRSIADVHKALVKAKARAIQTEYDDDGAPSSVAFSVDTAYGLRFFTLPVNAERVWRILQRDPKVKNAQATMEHAHRVAWRIVKDWLEAQLAILEAGMVTFDQVMLPYMHAEGKVTMYEMYCDRQLALPAGPT